MDRISFIQRQKPGRRAPIVEKWNRQFSFIKIVILFGHHLFCIEWAFFSRSTHSDLKLRIPFIKCTDKTTALNSLSHRSYGAGVRQDVYEGLRVVKWAPSLRLNTFATYEKEISWSTKTTVTEIWVNRVCQLILLVITQDILNRWLAKPLTYKAGTCWKKNSLSMLEIRSSKIGTYFLSQSLNGQ